MTSIGEIPQSSALAEASGDSLAEVMSRDPEGLSRQDRDRIISFLREQRERIATAEANGTVKPRGSGPKAPLKEQSEKNASDLDL